MQSEPTAEQRLTSLERRLERVMAISLLLGVGLALSIVWQFVPRPALDAQRFMLRDSTGTWRGALMLREDGSPVLRLNDAQARARLYGVITPDGRPRLRLTDSSGVHRIILEMNEEGEGHVRLSDSAGRARAQAWVDSLGRGWAELSWGARTEVFTVRDSTTSGPPATNPRRGARSRVSSRW